MYIVKSICIYIYTYISNNNNNNNSNNNNTTHHYHYYHYYYYYYYYYHAGDTSVAGVTVWPPKPHFSHARHVLHAQCALPAASEARRADDDFFNDLIAFRI